MRAWFLKSTMAAGLIAMLLIVGLIVYVETHHRIPAFRAWTFGLVFLLFATATALARERWRNALLVCATFSFGLFALEGAASWLSPGRDLVMTPHGLEIAPVVGFGFAHPGVIHAVETDARSGHVIYDARYTIGASGDRVVTSAATGPAIVFFGDSYTFGNGLNDADTLPQRLADLYGGQRRVINLAVPGFSPQQFLREVDTGYKDDVIGSRPDVFIFLTSPFHAMRTACKESWTNHAPRYGFVDGHVTYEGECLTGVSRAFHEFLDNTALYRLAIRPVVTRLTRADVDLYIGIIAEAAQRAKTKYGVDTLVPFVRFGRNYLAGTGYDDDAIIAALHARGVWVLDTTLQDDPTKGLIYSIPGDGHPTAAANAARARMIAAALRRPDSSETAGSAP